MLIPRYWSEQKAQGSRSGRKVTVRRFGWSNASQVDADANGAQRVQQAVQKLQSGESISRREPKVPYNGAEGVPIREEIIAEYGETIITRNSYGARCLNSPSVLFADIDFDDAALGAFGFCLVEALMLIIAVVMAIFYSKTAAIVVLLLSMVLLGIIGRRIETYWRRRRIRQRTEAAPKKLARFIEQRPDWSLRVYGTPNGLRILATHRLFDPTEPAVAEFFQALETDPIYARMCRNQQCFRARVSAKPWRIGIDAHLRPRPGVWPVAAERMPLRLAWVEKYEEAAKRYAACQYLSTLGSGIIHAAVKPVQELHDELCSVGQELPIA
jgi:hypothetical protein